MTVIDTTTFVEKVTDFASEPGDHDKMAHIVYPADGLTEAYIMGTPVQALCGHVWSPTRAPDPFPVCQRCIEVYETIAPGRPWHGRRD